MITVTETEQTLRSIAEGSKTRKQLWIDLINSKSILAVAEIGVYRGQFAESLLRGCPSIEKYYLLDPWRHLGDWNKPANVSNQEFDQYLEETTKRTDFASGKRVFLRGTTTEVIDQIDDESLDLAYIDGDHTLRGITIDLMRAYSKVRAGGWIGGDDFSRTIWQHETKFEPTLVFPFAVYFAEAVGAEIFSLPFSQFVLRKPHEERPGQFAFHDLAGHYDNLSLGKQLGIGALVTRKAVDLIPWAKPFAHKAVAALRKRQ